MSVVAVAHEDRAASCVEDEVAPIREVPALLLVAAGTDWRSLAHVATIGIDCMARQHRDMRKELELWTTAVAVERQRHVVQALAPCHKLLQ